MSMPISNALVLIIPLNSPLCKLSVMRSTVSASYPALYGNIPDSGFPCSAISPVLCLPSTNVIVFPFDEVIKTIKSSASIPDAKEKLIERFGLTDVQAQAIVEMTLGKLSGLERQKVEDRLAKLAVIVDELRSILADENKVKDIINKVQMIHSVDSLKLAKEISKQNPNKLIVAIICDFGERYLSTELFD